MNRARKRTDLDDDPLAVYRDVRWDRKALSDSRHFIAEGRLCVQRLLQSDLPVESILVAQGREDEAAGWCSQPTPIYSLPTDEMRSLVGFDFHRGFMACGVRPDIKTAETRDLHDATGRLGLAAMQVSERENLGSMMRSAAAFGVDTILLGPGTADPFSRRVIRVSMGTVFRLKLLRMEQPIEQLALFQAGGVRAIATSLAETATSLDRFQRDTEPYLLLMGNEAGGLSEGVRAMADHELKIPMKMGIDSLNVGVAAAVFLFALRPDSDTKSNA